MMGGTGGNHYCTRALLHYWVVSCGVVDMCGRWVDTDTSNSLQLNCVLFMAFGGCCGVTISPFPFCRCRL